MAQEQKFGTFGGVFTPSILTILGVIMYLRLPWIVGQAGLWMTIGIIVVAHVISVTTGLSVSSIATDKKVKVGGNYYIISRSLGLSIGGTLGIALFVGLSFSVSLYIIGFVESFLPTVGIEATKNAIRIYGTIAVFAVAGIVLVSTSLALKAQYFIMAAILLSLLSIFLGKPIAAPTAPLFTPPAGGAPMILLFGIFFPAVTGFTAGVQMSGDLKDPKSSIPIGTMASILVGFVVYIGLATFLAYRVDAATLVGNVTILQDISWMPAFLYAGIWGATLSSAMGSLLGAPRILQATSMDRITPRIFAKGHGPSSEPRNALVLTILIAEAGILIGELNVIAAIISTFFITTYGFINLSCAVETWASPDFRPSFKIPTWVSVLGAVASFLVMIELDLLSFVGATLLLGLLYLGLKRKELTLESGDTWEGIWSSIIRSGMHHLSQTVSHARNWRPNIILFSGGTSARPHLIEFGKWIVHKRGILSNFDLKENAGDKLLFPKTEQSQYDTDETAQGIFSRRLECGDIYEGMETIAQVFGFAGIEPNTVMMGWARNSRDPLQFAQLIRRLSALDYNVLMLDYDSARGFGERRRIDIWWRGGNNNATLSLAILKYLKASEEWQEAEARILILIDNSALINRVHKNMNQILEDQRIEATIKIINNAIESHPFTEVIKRESSEADLILLGIPKITDGNAAEFVTSVNALVAELGTTLLVHASSFFESLYIGIEMQVSQREKSEGMETKTVATSSPQVALPTISGGETESHDRLVHAIALLHDEIERALQSFVDGFLGNANQIGDAFIADLAGLLERNLGALEKRLAEEANPRFRRSFARIQSDSLFNMHRLFEQYHGEKIHLQREYWELGLEQLFADFERILDNLPPVVTVFHEEGDTKTGSADSLYLRQLKFWKRIGHRVFKRSIAVDAPFKRLISNHFKTCMQRAIYAQQEAFGIENYRFIASLQKWLPVHGDALGSLERRLHEGQLAAEDIAREKTSLTGPLREIGRLYGEQLRQLGVDLLSGNRLGMQKLCDEVVRLDVKRRAKRESPVLQETISHKEKICAVPAMWSKNLTLMVNYALVELTLMAFRHRLSVIFQKVMRDIQTHVEGRHLDPLARLGESLQEIAAEAEEESEVRFPSTLNLREELDVELMTDELMRGIQTGISEMPETIEIIAEESFQQIETRQYRDIEVATIDLHRLVDYLMETELVEPFQKQLSQLPGHLQRGVRAADDIVRLVRFRKENAETRETGESADSQESMQDIVASCLLRIDEEQEQTAEALELFRKSAQTFLNATFGKLNLYLMTRLAGNIVQHIRAQESRKVIFGIEVGRQRLRNFFHNLLVRLLYHRSEGLLLARRLHEAGSQRETFTDATLTLVENVGASPRVLSTLPLYYRQLFIGKQSIGREYWVGRAGEMKRAETAVRRYRQGFSGGLLIVGEPNSGKTSLSRKIAMTHFDQHRVYHLFAPESGGIEPAYLKKRLAETLGIQGEYEEMFRALPRDSVLVLHDFELWWERSPGGQFVVDEILHLIDRFSPQCLFIVNTSIHSFHFLQNYRSIARAFLDTIHCEPFDTEELQQAILLRHRSTGLKFELGDRLEDNISAFALARHFTRFFDYTAGNIGFALRTWIGSIEKVTGERLVLKTPRRPDLQALEQLGDEERVWLQQFVLHKYLTSERLGRLFRAEESAIQVRLTRLKRAGLITEFRPDILEVNPYLQPFVIQELDERGML